jgi:HTH-type transcriptional regulator/antitoxin HigA
LNKETEMIVEAIKPIRSNEDYQAALTQIDRLSDAQEGTEEFDRLDILATLVEAYEAKHYPIGPPSFEAAVDYEMEKRGITRE